MLNEKQKAEEAEQEQRAKLLRSRNKKEEDPEREKKKKDAKMKQQAIQEREQLKQADETALIASQRKRPTTSVVSYYCFYLYIYCLFIILRHRRLYLVDHLLALLE